MFCRNITAFICIVVAAVIATEHNDPNPVTGKGSGPEVTVYSLTTENPESSTRETEQQVTETAAVDLGALLDAGDGARITLVAGDTRLVAHRAVLVHRSPMFASKLQHMTMETSGGPVVIPDVEGPVLRQMLAYMYTLQAPQLPGMADQLLVAADAYGLSALKAHCEQQLAVQLSVENAVTAAILAVQHFSATLRQAAISFIKPHIFHVMATQGWADAMNSQPEELMKVIRLLSESAVEASAAAAATSGAAPTTQPDSDHSGQTPASAAPTTAAPHTPTPDYAAVCPLWSLSAGTKNRWLIEAAKEGAGEAVEALLAAGADLEAGDEDRWTALHWAAREGHVDVARRLLAAGAAVDARGGSQQWTPLHWAAHEGYVEVARSLLVAGADVEARSRGGHTPLHRAAWWGHAALVRLLLEEASADVNARQEGGWTPLHEAAANGKAEAAAALLQAGANRAATDYEGRTPLDFAREKNHQQLVDMLAT